MAHWLPQHPGMVRRSSDDDQDFRHLLVLGHAFRDVHAFEGEAVPRSAGPGWVTPTLDEFKPAGVAGGERLYPRIKAIL